MRVRHRRTVRAVRTPPATGGDGSIRAGDAGASAVEYSLVAMGVAGVMAAAVLGFGDRLAGVFDCLSGQLGGTVAGCGTGGGTGIDLPPVDTGSGTGGGPTTTAPEPPPAPTTGSSAPTTGPAASGTTPTPTSTTTSTTTSTATTTTTAGTTG